MAHSDAEELDYLLFIKVKKGEKRLHVRYLLNNECNEYQGPFDLDSSVNHLIQYHNRVFPGTADKWRVTPENEATLEGRATCDAALPRFHKETSRHGGKENHPPRTSGK